VQLIWHWPVGLASACARAWREDPDRAFKRAVGLMVAVTIPVWIQIGARRGWWLPELGAACQAETSAWHRVAEFDQAIASYRFKQAAYGRTLPGPSQFSEERWPRVYEVLEERRAKAAGPVPSPFSPLAPLGNTPAVVGSALVYHFNHLVFGSFWVVVLVPLYGLAGVIQERKRWREEQERIQERQRDWNRRPVPLQVPQPPAAAVQLASPRGDVREAGFGQQRDKKQR
jgi:hypothetical protein